ncbi:hypothetical protein JCM3766R1_002291 [Sporobolomyces carnicolor]
MDSAKLADSPPRTPLNSPTALSHFDFSPARSSTLDSPTTSYADTSPSRALGDRDWQKFDAFERAQEASKAPPGFIHLDDGYANEVGISRTARSCDWQLASAAYSSQKLLKRRLGPTESSYYLGSRGEGKVGGVNDMYLHIGFRAPSKTMSEGRVLAAWKTILARHVLLSSSVEFSGFYDARFVYQIPRNAREFHEFARSRLRTETGTSAEVLLNSYLNGERLLGDDRLAYLVLSTPEQTFSNDSDEIQDYDFFLFSTHFIGDGMALHTTANEFFTLLAADGDIREPFEPSFERDLDLSLLPPTLEDHVKVSGMQGSLAWQTRKADLGRIDAKNIGGQTFARASRGPRHTVVPTVSFSLAESKRILSKCKSHGSTIASALFALSNLAYIRSTPADRMLKALPTNFYSALNVRGILRGQERKDPYHLAIGYYNIILPSFYPPASTVPTSTYFWHQAASVRRQTSRIVKSPFLTSRTVLMAFERERKSIGFERAAEESTRASSYLQKGVRGLGITSDGDAVDKEIERMRREAEDGERTKERAKAKEQRERDSSRSESTVPKDSLMGLSMLGNLDGIYDQGGFAERGFELDTLTTGSRQRPGALLLFSYTFAGKLWISLGYDSNGFVEGTIEAWWRELLRGVDEILLA